MRKLLKRRSGEGYIDVCVLVVCAMLVLALVVRVLPVYITKQQLDTYAVELVRRRLPTAPGLTLTSGGPPPDASNSTMRSL